MKINNPECKDYSIGKIKRFISDCSKYINNPINTKSSLSKKINNINLKNISINNKDCEKLLYLIKKKRKNSLPKNEIKVIVYFLLLAYYQTKDVRYFNEYL